MTDKTNKVLSKGANDVVKALNQVKQLLSNVEVMKEEITNLDYEIRSKEDELLRLQESYSNTERQLLLELDLKVKEGMTKHVDEFLTATDRIAINKNMYTHLTEIESNFENKLVEETSKLRQELNSKYLSEMNLKLAQINAERAEDKAAVKTLETRLTDALKNAEIWKTQLEAERSASVERSKASAIGSVNVSGK